ncbi:MAG: TlpA family protein disulfide reductase [Bacteroidetes bacterium]|nr:TlpA family protein disulfide reductase [Bacteroidota bacterium]MCL6103362.1 TlpA family protein disulfide reductase [Bacteroidota bacterium]
MSFKTFYSAVKKRGLSVLLISFLIIIVFVPDAKSLLLQQLVSVGLFKAEIKKNGVNNLPQTASFSFTNSAGITVTTAGLKGKVVFINFWASWCPPCRAEMPSLDELYKKLQNDDRFVFLFINEDEDKSKAIKYLEKNHFTIPLYSRLGDVPNEIFSGTLPTTVVIDKDGKVVLKHEGLAGYNTDAFIRQLKDLL